MQLEQGKAALNETKLMKEAQIKKELMNHEFQINMQLRGIENETIDKRDDKKEDTLK